MLYYHSSFYSACISFPVPCTLPNHWLKSSSPPKPSHQNALSMDRGVQRELGARRNEPLSMRISFYSIDRMIRNSILRQFFGIAELSSKDREVRQIVCGKKKGRSLNVTPLRSCGEYDIELDGEIPPASVPFFPHKANDPGRRLRT